MNHGEHQRGHHSTGAGMDETELAPVPCHQNGRSHNGEPG